MLSLLSASNMVHPLWAETAKLTAAPIPHLFDGTSQPEHDERTHALTPVFTWLKLDEVKPDGWIKEQMVRDLNEGFAVRLDELCHEASSDIFVTHRNSGILENAVNAAKNNWWNGETEGNWRAGFIMMAYLAEDKQAMQKADDYVRHILSSQGEDGYLGVFAPDVRFSKPGELWTQACLLRGLLDYAELTGDEHVMETVRCATDISVRT
jgi:hypothetical protein